MCPNLDTWQQNPYLGRNEYTPVLEIPCIRSGILLTLHQGELVSSAKVSSIERTKRSIRVLLHHFFVVGKPLGPSWLGFFNIHFRSDLGSSNISNKGAPNLNLCRINKQSLKPDPQVKAGVSPKDAHTLGWATSKASTAAAPIEGERTRIR